MKRLIVQIIFLLFCYSFAVGQQTSNKWVLQGGFSDWEIFLQERQYMQMISSLSVSRVIGNRFLLGGKLMSDLAVSWPSDTRSGSWAFGWAPTWLGITGKAYLQKVPRLEKILNPYIELGLGGILQSGLKYDSARMNFERVTRLQLNGSVGAGASLWMIPELSMDFHLTYLPYFEEGGSRFGDLRPHQLLFGISFSYWFEKQRKRKMR